MTRRVKPKGRQRNNPADCYFDDVLSGKIVAGPGVRGTAHRHFRDLKRQGAKGFPFVWSDELGDRVCQFFETRLRLSIGETDGDLFKLFPWQHGYIRSIFSWIHKETGLRRFRVIYLETSKSSGKSAMHAGVAVYMLMADGEKLPQVFIAARDKEQARVLFSFAEEMVKRDDEMSSMCQVYGGANAYNITYRNSDTGNWGFLRRIATQSDAKGASGPIPSCALVDEVHELDSEAIIESLRKGAKTRRQPLLLLSTNSGESRESIGWDYHEHALKVSCGEVDDDAHFAMVFGGDKDDDPIEDESVWVKSNPSLPKLPGYDYLRAEVALAKSMPSRRNLTLRLNFGAWLESGDSWIEGALWERCEVAELDESVLSGLPAVVAFDLSARRDLTAGVVVWCGEGERLYARVKFWLPAEGLLVKEREDRVPYSVWRDEGVLESTPGRVVDYEYPVRWLVELADAHDVRGVAFDRWKADEFLRLLSDAGVKSYMPDVDGVRRGGGLPVWLHGQGLWRGKTSKKSSRGGVGENGLLDVLSMPTSIDKLEESIAREWLSVELNPCMRWCINSAVTVADASGNRKFEKRKSTGRIDGCVALAMATGLVRVLPVKSATTAKPIMVSVGG